MGTEFTVKERLEYYKKLLKDHKSAYEITRKVYERNLNTIRKSIERLEKEKQEKKED